MADRRLHTGERDGDAASVRRTQTGNEGAWDREGQQIVFERRFGGDRLDRFADVAAEPVRSRVDLIVTSTDAAIAAVKQQTRTIPIVMANSTDPVATGFAASLAHPGGNITGNSSMAPALSGKRLEVLREIVPGLRRVAVLWNPDIRGAVLEYQATESVATSFHLVLQSVEVGRSDSRSRNRSCCARTT